MRRILLAAVLLARPLLGQSLDGLRVGNWVEMRGEVQADGRFASGSLEVLPPSDLELLVGTAVRADLSSQSFRVLGRTVRVSDKTRWQSLSLRSIEGKRVKVEGHWRGGFLAARKISARDPGRDHIGGRVDQIVRTAGGLELDVQGFQVLLPAGAKLQNEKPFSDLPLAPALERGLAGEHTQEQEEDYVPGTVRLAERLTFGGLVEYKYVREDNLDLDHAQSRDRVNQRLDLKGQLTWVPSESFHALLLERYEFEDRRRENGRVQRTGNAHLDELWGYWSDVAVPGFDLQIGRQDFDDGRRWLYKSKLDAVRAIWDRPGVRLELSASTRTFDAAPSEEPKNLIAYLSNGNPHREIAAYVIDRRDNPGRRDYPIWFGARALGAWIPQNEVWAEASLLRGFSNDFNLSGEAFDIGTTWSPAWTGPVSFTLGWAYGSGDNRTSATTDESFRQTGIQQNRGKWSGVSNFRYYGEVLDPELSNLTILTAGIGTRLAQRTSLDLVWHHYDQVEALAFLRNAGLETNPDGFHRFLGQEMDVVLGTKIIKGWDFALSGGWFHPGDAFPQGDDAYLASFLVRFRF